MIYIEGMEAGHGVFRIERLDEPFVIHSPGRTKATTQVNCGTCQRSVWPETHRS